MQTLQNISVGEEFVYGLYKWVKLNSDENGILVIAKDLTQEPIVYTTRHTNDWELSKLRSWLKYSFFNCLLDNGAEEEKFLNFDNDHCLNAASRAIGRNDCIGILTSEEYEEYRDIIPPVNEGYWVLPSKSYLDSFNTYVINCTADGVLEWVSPSTSLKVRPVCKLNPDTVVYTTVEEKKVMVTTTEKIRQWFKARGLDKGDPVPQMVKLMEETGELAEGINKQNMDLIKDSIGDVYVVLTGLALQLGMDIEDCIDSAYDEIKDRKGVVIDGIFVKETDMHNKND